MQLLEEQELKQLQDQEQRKNAIVNDLGVLELRKHELLHAFAIVQSDQEKMKIDLEAKYGKISIDLKDGSFTGIEEEVQQEE